MSIFSASRGFRVIAVDVNEQKPEALREERLPIYERGWRTYSRSPSRGDGSIYLGFVERVSKSLGRALGEKENYHLVVIRSTVVPSITQSAVNHVLREESENIRWRRFRPMHEPRVLERGLCYPRHLEPR